jgi:hypothetical protein
MQCPHPPAFGGHPLPLERGFPFSLWEKVASAIGGPDEGSVQGKDARLLRHRNSFLFGIALSAYLG